MQKEILVFAFVPALLFNVAQWCWSMPANHNDYVRAELALRNATIVNGRFFYKNHLPAILYNHDICCAPTETNPAYASCDETDVVYFCRSFFENCDYPALDCVTSKRWFYGVYVCVSVMLRIAFFVGKFFTFWLRANTAVTSSTTTNIT